MRGQRAFDILPVVFMVAAASLASSCSSSDSADGSSSGASSSGNGGSSSGAASSSSGSSGAGDGGGSSSSSSSGGGDGGTSGGVGIASKYPGDVGIAADPDVIFADDFESYTQASDLSQKWDNFFQVAQTKIVTAQANPANVKAGQKALEFTLPKANTELSNAVQKILKNELDVLYLRFYSKFDKTNDIVGSSHNGGGISAHYFNGNQATPGIPANGTNKYLIEFECWRGEAVNKAPGVLNIYIYHPDQLDGYGDHFYSTGARTPYSPTPYDFGTSFVKRPDITPDLDRWYAYEVMLKANTPGQRDGRVTMWLDGEIIGDFPNLRLRDVDTLKIDRFNLSFHARNVPADAKKWYDNVVAAKSYIGPMK